jgi:peptidyl-prolyl cis-trans isomerase C
MRYSANPDIVKRASLFYFKVVLVALWIALFATACNGGSSGKPTSTEPNGSPPAEQTPTVALTETPAATKEPLAAQVNETGISLAEYQAELAMFEAASGALPSQDAKNRVLQDLIDQVLLAQGAAEQGFVVDAEQVQARIVQLINQLGSAQALDDWIRQRGYTQEIFEKSLQRSLAAAWMRDHIAQAVPLQAEHVHARQILLYNSETANQVLAQLRSGAVFEDLALQYDPLTGGDLGWFPRGYLPERAVEQAAFEMQPGEISAVVQSLAGYHILQVIERDSQRLLHPEALLILQSQAVADWLEQRRSQSTIQTWAP